MSAASLCCAEDGEFVPLASKHAFNLGTLGILLGMLQEGLQGGQPCMPLRRLGAEVSVCVCGAAAGADLQVLDQQ